MRPAKEGWLPSGDPLGTGVVEGGLLRRILKDRKGWGRIWGKVGEGMGMKCEDLQLK